MCSILWFKVIIIHPAASASFLKSSVTNFPWDISLSNQRPSLNNSQLPCTLTDLWDDWVKAESFLHREGQFFGSKCVMGFMLPWNLPANSGPSLYKAWENPLKRQLWLINHSPAQTSEQVVSYHCKAKNQNSTHMFCLLPFLRAACTVDHTPPGSLGLSHIGFLSASPACHVSFSHTAFQRAASATWNRPGSPFISHKCHLQETFSDAHSSPRSLI